MAGAAGAAVTVPSRGDGTRERVLDAALEVLREVGYGGFSVQKVARSAGVYQGNITYYWPRRRDLVRAVAGRVIDEYRRTFLAGVDLSTRGAADLASATLRWMVVDAVTVERVRLMPEVWSMANADPQVAEEVTRCADEVTDVLAELLGAPAGAPHGAAVRRALRAAGAAALGLTAVHGHRSADDPVLAELIDDVVALHAPALTRALDATTDRSAR